MRLDDLAFLGVCPILLSLAYECGAVMERIFELMTKMGVDPRGLLERLESRMGEASDPSGCSSLPGTNGLGSGLPYYLVEEGKLEAAWIMLYGSKKNFLNFFKRFLETTIVGKQAKFISSYSVDHCIQLSEICDLPEVRNSVFKFGSESQRTFSETMMMQLLDFEVYKNFTLEMSRNVIQEAFMSEIAGLFPIKLKPVAELLDTLLFSNKTIARMYRLSKLDDLLTDFESQDEKTKMKLVLGIFGLFDNANLPLLFCKFVESYPVLKPYYTKNYFVHEYLESSEPEDWVNFNLHQMYIELFSFEDISYRIGVWQHLSAHQVFQRYSEQSLAIGLSIQAMRFDDLLGQAKKNVKLFNDLPDHMLIDSLEKSSGIQKRLLAVDLVKLTCGLEKLLSDPFIAGLSNKDSEKEKLIESLRLLDHSDLEAALSLAQKVRDLAIQYVDAPEDVKSGVERFIADVDRYLNRVISLDNTSHTSGTNEAADGEDKIECLLLTSGLQSSESNLLGNSSVESASIDDIHNDCLEEISRLENENQQLELLIDEQSKTIRSYKAKEHQYRVVDGSRSIAPLVESETVSKAKMVDYIVDGVDTPEKILKFFAEMYPESLTVMDSAFASAVEAADFKNLARLRTSILLLVTDYLDEVNSGGSSHQANKLIGSSLRSGESEIVNQNPRLKSMREFVYNGSKLHFTKHIAIGNKYGTANSIRVYFEILDKKVVIAYCGEHLRTNMTS